MIVAIIQARMSSKRLPGKVLMEIEGVPVLGIIIKRLEKVESIDKIIVATSDNPEDDEIELFCKFNNILCYRGNLDNVLERFVSAANQLHLSSDDCIVRVTADCPLIDYVIVENTIDLLIRNSDMEYAANVVEHVFPDGYDVEVFRRSVLDKLKTKNLKKSDCEHVTIYLHNHPEEFRMIGYTTKENYGFLRLTLDELSDFEVIVRVVNAIKSKKIDEILYDDIIQLYHSNPQIFISNSSIMRNEGYKNSLLKE